MQLDSLSLRTWSVSKHVVRVEEVAIRSQYNMSRAFDVLNIRSGISVSASFWRETRVLTSPADKLMFRLRPGKLVVLYFNGQRSRLSKEKQTSSNSS